MVVAVSKWSAFGARYVSRLWPAANRLR